MLLKKTEELLPEEDRELKIMTIWALLQPQKAGWTMEPEAEEIMKEIGIKKKGYTYDGLIDVLRGLEDDVLDAWIKKATCIKFHQLSEKDLKSASDMVGFEIKKHWSINKEYLEMHTKEELEKLKKELNIKSEVTGKKKEIIADILTNPLIGRIPKVMQ